MLIVIIHNLQPGGGGGVGELSGEPLLLFWW